MKLRSTRSTLGALVLLTTAFEAAPAEAQLTMAQARQAIDAAEAEARANGWNLTIYVADAAGAPIYLRRMDGASARTTDVVRMKVTAVIETGGTSGAYGQALADGTRDTIPGAIHFEGGIPIIFDGEIVGAMSASGARGSEDAQAVRAGLAAIGAESGG